MTNTAAIIAERLRDAAERIPVESRFDAITQAANAPLGQAPDGHPTPTVVVIEPAIQARRPRVHWVRFALVAASCAAIVGGLVVAARPGKEATQVTSEARPVAPIGIPEGAPSPGSVAPIIEEPPDWFGRRQEGRRDGALHTGRWVSTAIGITTDDGTTRFPISVAVTDGSLRGLNATRTVVIDGETFRQIQFGQWQTLATTGQPTIVVSGAVEGSLLAEVHRAVRLVAFPDGPSLQLGDLPDGYSELLPPQLHAEDVADRRTLTNAASDVSITEISDWVEPELAAAATGAEYRPVDIGDLKGWTGQTEFNAFGPIKFLMWSPSPGVVLEIDTTNSDHTFEDLVELANLTRVLPIAQWDEAIAGR